MQVLGPVSDDPPPLPFVAWREGRRVGESYQRDIECIQEHQEPIVLIRGIRLHDAAELIRVGGGDAYRYAVKSGKAYDHIGGEVLLQL